jgi:phosphate acetyltransferase
MMFEHQLVERARSDRKHIVLPEGEDDRILVAADRLLRRNVVDLTILGPVDGIAERARTMGLDLSSAVILDPETDPLRSVFAADLTEIRSSKGLALDAAFDLVADVSYFGTMMVWKGLADGMVSGAAHTTAHTIRPALQIIKTTPGVSIVSSVFFMALEDRVLVYGDCAVNPDPNAEQLADIAISSAETSSAFGVDPRIAMLSYSTGSSGSGADVEKVREATRIARERRPDLAIEGPIQYDAAVDASVAKSKLPDSTVAGRATVFIFPDLNTGNNTYKAVQRSANAVAIGPVLQGLRLPVNDLSRGALVEDIINTVVITAVQAQQVAGSAAEEGA